ncbi:type II secretion system protein GspD [Pseudoduganella lutea]|uniref:Type II secretion system protein GspD n=1 Tax=Pseudoduganella lutea TaxID=321985 RepID=A0A4V0Z424_9BURK|nr:secretin N-terminal domain-containing protein [Pseudoduganella lutea]QBE65453.1 type II secretion system protein GspD [Pseudoduganella lutea]
MKLRHRPIVLAMLCALLAGHTAAASAPAATATGDTAATAVMSYTFRDTPIAELFNMISRTARINIVLGRGVGGNVSINLYDLTVREAVHAIAEAGGYTVSERPGGFLIADPKAGGKDAAGTQVKSLKVRYADVKKVGEILARQVGALGTVTVLEQTKSVVIESTAAGIERATRALRAIDVAPQQILIEAKILEITLDQAENFGIDWSRVFNSNGPDMVGTTGFATRGGPLFYLGVINNNIEVYLSALSNKGRVHTLATPRLLALEDQEATTNVGDQLGYRLTTTINNVTSESIQFLDTGVILRVTPSVDADGRIVMKVRPEVSSGTVSAGIPSKKTTEVNTQLVANDGQAVLIGGLIKSSRTYRRQGVPFLADLPVVGKAFSSTDDGGLTTETIVVITPRIVPPGGIAIDDASERKLQQAERNLDVRSDALDRKLERIAPSR